MGDENPVGDNVGPLVGGDSKKFNQEGIKEKGRADLQSSCLWLLAVVLCTENTLSPHLTPWTSWSQSLWPSFLQVRLWCLHR